MAPFYLSQWVLTVGPETEAAKYNSAIIRFIIYISAFPAVTRLNVFCGKGPFHPVTFCVLSFW